VFEGNTADPLTLSARIDKLKQRFRLQRVVMVGDRGMLTGARIEQTAAETPAPTGRRSTPSLSSYAGRAVPRFTARR